jgi:hypothetical protein
VAVTDIPGAFLHADMEDDVHMLLEGNIAELIVKLDPTLYRKYIWENKNGKPMLYVKLQKALYGMLQAAILFRQLLSDTLIGWGFKLNEYDKCVTNKIINGKQCTIIWHVDDLKISHVEQKVISNIIKKLEDKFGQESPLMTSQGKVIEYLGICINYIVKGKVNISMYKYIDKMLAELPSDMNGVSTTLAALHLFNLDDGAQKLDEDRAQLFHHLVAKLLYLSRRSRQDTNSGSIFMYKSTVT